MNVIYGIEIRNAQEAPQMKTTLKRVIALMVKNNTLWTVLKPISSIGLILYSERRKHRRGTKEEKSGFYKGFELLTVLNGPFKGMRYPTKDSVGSTIYPKLLGSYESELHKVFAEFSANSYTEILDIGCAEGYYAVGLAMKYKDTKVFAYDIQKEARQRCKQMAKLNKVEQQVNIQSVLTPELLGNFRFSGRGLIICDCEGFEMDLFNDANSHHLSNCDMIIELHDFKNIHISTHLKNLLQKTHNLESIYSVDDVQKALRYEFPELTGLPLEHKRNMVNEKRTVMMEWLICRARG